MQMKYSAMNRLFGHMILVAWSTLGFSIGAGAMSETLSKDDVKAVLLYEILMNPDIYDGQNVSVSGYFYFGSGGARIYAYRDDALYGNVNASLMISDKTFQDSMSAPENRDCSDSYVHVNARFQTVDNSFRGFFLKEIHTVVAYKVTGIETALEVGEHLTDFVRLCYESDD